MTSSEGRGSLHSILKSRGWVTSLSAGVGDEGMHRSSIAYIFGMSMHLTDSGLEKVVFFIFVRSFSVFEEDNIYYSLSECFLIGNQIQFWLCFPSGS